MHTTGLLVASFLGSSALAAPFLPRAESKSMMVDAEQWTITSLQRVCDEADTTCSWSFGINNGTGVTPCTEVVTGTPASDTNGGPVTCGVYTVTSGWSGQFGAGQGFTTFAVVNYPANLIVYPAYTDNQVQNGTVVTPDQSYTPQALP